MLLWIDDVLEAPCRAEEFDDRSYDMVARNFDEAVAALATGKITGVDFDYNLCGKNGGDIAKWVEARAREGGIGPFEYAVHSGDFRGKGEIIQTMRRVQQIWDTIGAMFRRAPAYKEAVDALGEVGALRWLYAGPNSPATLLIAGRGTEIKPPNC